MLAASSELGLTLNPTLAPTLTLTLTLTQDLREMIGRLQVAQNFAAAAATQQLTELTEGMALHSPEGGMVPGFLCPITQEVMDDPVITSDGHTYERVAIEQWCTAPS